MSSSSDSSELMYFLAIFLRLAGVFFDDDDELSFDEDALLKCLLNFIFMLSESDESESSTSLNERKVFKVQHRAFARLNLTIILRLIWFSNFLFSLCKDVL